MNLAYYSYSGITKLNGVVVVLCKRIVQSMYVGGFYDGFPLLLVFSALH